MSTQIKPLRGIPVPAHFVKQDLRCSVIMIARQLLTLILPVGGACFLLASDLPQVVIWTLALLLALAASFGLHALGLIGHEGTHFTLHPKRIVSAYMGVLVSALAPFHLDMGFAIRHNQHHRFTNTEKDPDSKIFARCPRLWQRLILARGLASLEYFKTTLVLAMNRRPEEWDGLLNLTRQQVVQLARVNLLASGLSVAGYAVMIILFPATFGIAFGLTFLFTFLLSGLRPYLEHAGTDTQRLSNARSWISKPFDILYGGINYHLAHHLAPAVPAYRIKSFHRWLEQEGYLSAGPTECIRSFGEGLAVVARQPYGRRQRGLLCPSHHLDK